MPVAVHGSTSRLANESEAERSAGAIAAMSQSSDRAPDRSQLRPLPQRPASAGFASAGKRLPDPIRSKFEGAFNYDLGAIRLHDDVPDQLTARVMGAAAFAAGNHIAVARPQYGPQHALGRQILAHEVAHVIQTALQPSAPAVHRYESPEHEDLGDFELGELVTFLQTDDGKKWAKDHHLDAAKLVQQIKADPLQKAGGKIIAGQRMVGAKLGKEPVALTPGEIIALSGDFYKEPEDIAAAASSQLGKEGDKNEIDQLLEAIAKERRGQLKDANATYNAITKGRYIDLAQKNDTHFAPLNRLEWRRLHTQAIAEAASAQDEAGLQHALLVDAAAGHFLTDAYAAGHLFKKNDLLAAIDEYLAKHPLTTVNPEVQLYAGIVTVLQKADQLVLKAIHDRMNAEGFDVTNTAGMSWRTYGDQHLAKAEDTKRIASLAIFVSRQQIYAANHGQKPDPKEVEALMPDDSTVDRATTQAIGYIPAAAAEAQAVMFRGRGVAATEFRSKLGVLGPVLAPVIESNISTIADPGRQRQLLELKEATEGTGFGPTVAPQWTVRRW
jgi:hypothetical protein